MKKNYNIYGFSTKSVHAGEEPNFKDGASGDVVQAIHLSTTYARKEVEYPTAGYEYSRSLNPTRKALEKKLSALENANFGLAFASGLAAETTILISLLKAGDHIIAFDDLYGGTKRLFSKVLNHHGLHTTYVDATDASLIENTINENTKMVWIETPSNPMLKVCDINRISKITKKHHLLLVVDNTFLSPYFQNPLDLGADVVVHSSTKYIGGHSDVVGGAVMVNDAILFEKLKFHQNAIGAVPSPFDCYLTMRGIKTLALRMERHQENALRIAEFLETHEKVSKVIYPGLRSHPQYDLSKAQTRGSGGIISFEINGTLSTARKFLQNLELFALAESLGGVESLIELPSLMTHSSISKQEREKVGIRDTLIRISTGIEDSKDLINDLKQSFNNL